MERSISFPDLHKILSKERPGAIVLFFNYSINKRLRRHSILLSLYQVIEEEAWRDRQVLQKVK